MDDSGIHKTNRNIFTSDTASGAIIRAISIVALIVAALSIGYFFQFLSARLNVAEDARAVPRGMTALKEEIALLRRDYEELKTENSNMRAEIMTLTQQNGVVDQIIGRIRTLQGEQQAILSVLAPVTSTTDASPIDDPGEPIAVAAKADHQIVTPRQTVQAVVSAAKAGPVVTPAQPDRSR